MVITIKMFARGQNACLLKLQSIKRPEFLTRGEMPSFYLNGTPLRLSNSGLRLSEAVENILLRLRASSKHKIN